MIKCEDCISMVNQTGMCYCAEIGVEPPEMRKDIVVSKVTVLVENSDGTHIKSENFMPHDIADHLHAKIVGWERHWTATFSDHDKYREAEKKFIEKMKSGNSTYQSIAPYTYRKDDKKNG